MRAFWIVTKDDADTFQGGSSARLAAQHDVQTIFCASDELKAFLCGGVLPVCRGRTLKDLLERTVDGKGICDFAEGHQ